MADFISGKDPALDRLKFMAHLRDAGFTNCPVCKNEEGFTWAHAADTPDGIALMDSWIPGLTTIPGAKDGKRESFPTMLWMLICDRCSHVMIFSQAHMEMSYKMRHGK